MPSRAAGSAACGRAGSDALAYREPRLSNCKRGASDRRKGVFPPRSAMCFIPPPTFIGVGIRRWDALSTDASRRTGVSRREESRHFFRDPLGRLFRKIVSALDSVARHVAGGSAAPQRENVETSTHDAVVAPQDA